MDPVSDSDLLARYADARDESAFAELLSRHLRLVYSAALRGANGDSTLAQDVTQLVFCELAKNARQLSKHQILAGWLHKKVWHLAANFRKADIRRRKREEDYFMNSTATSPEQLWNQLTGSIDEAM